jgi:hypothetical protein
MFRQCFVEIQQAFSCDYRVGLIRNPKAELAVAGRRFNLLFHRSFLSPTVQKAKSRLTSIHTDGNFRLEP